MSIISLNSLNQLALLTNTDSYLCKVRTKLFYKAWLRLFTVEARVPYRDSACTMCGKRSNGLFTEYFDFPVSNFPAILHSNLYPITTLIRKNKEPNTRKLKNKTNKTKQNSALPEIRLFSTEN